MTLSRIVPYLQAKSRIIKSKTNINIEIVASLVSYFSKFDKNMAKENTLKIKEQMPKNHWVTMYTQPRQSTSVAMSFLIQS